MVKGAKLRKCWKCGKHIFWIIPDGEILGLPMAKDKKITDWVLRKNKYWCAECWAKEQE